MGKKSADFRNMLQEEFDSRKQSRPGYSLSTFARLLGISKSHLSRILRGKHGISEPTALKLSNALKLSPHRRRLFMGFAAKDYSKDANTQKRAAKDLKHVLNDKLVYLPDDLAITWVCEAVCEALTVLKLPAKALPGALVRELVKYLAITEAQATESLEVLKNVQLLENNRGMLLPKSDARIGFRAHDKIYFEGPLQKSLEVIRTRSPRHWVISSGVLSIEATKQKEALGPLETFMNSFAETFGTSKKADDVVMLNAHLFSLKN